MIYQAEGPFSIYLDGDLKSSNATSPYTFTNLSAGYYQTKVVDGLGSEALCEAEITEPEYELQAEWEGQILCYDSLYQSGVTSPFVFDGLDAGLYNVEVIDAEDCTDNANVTITQPDVLECTIQLMKIADCETSNGSATVTPTGGTGPYTYLWSNGETDANVCRCCSLRYQ